jgi:hypothetical protein
LIFSIGSIVHLTLLNSLPKIRENKHSYEPILLSRIFYFDTLRHAESCIHFSFLFYLCSRDAYLHSIDINHKLWALYKNVKETSIEKKIYQYTKIHKIVLWADILCYFKKVQTSGLYLTQCLLWGKVLEQWIFSGFLFIFNH